MNMIEMKRTQAEKSKEEAYDINVMEEDDYPYGLSIDLDMGSLEKLGKKVDDFSIGDEMKIHVMVKVKALRSSESEGSSDSSSVDLQITQMAFEPKDGETDEKRMSRMYGDSSG